MSQHSVQSCTPLKKCGLSHKNMANVTDHTHTRKKFACPAPGELDGGLAALHAGVHGQHLTRPHTLFAASGLRDMLGAPGVPQHNHHVWPP